jgi:hypothetical protein
LAGVLPLAEPVLLAKKLLRLSPAASLHKQEKAEKKAAKHLALRMPGVCGLIPEFFAL